ncbi:hypothetical protein MTP99_005449 [Tenebrio molitor]|nr:hypothetical protein MTP99_005449 [Tenebrio molitor]
MWNKPSRYREDRDECFPVMYKIFVKFGHHKIKKIVSVLCLLIQFLFCLLQLYYIIIKFDKDLLIRYSCTTISTLYVFYAVTFDTTYKNQNRLDQFQNFAWSLDSAGAEVKSTILEKTTKTNRICYLMMVFLGLAVVINFPVLGDQSELVLCIRVFDRLNDWDKRYSVQYQKDIKESLQLAIKQHCAIIRYVKNICKDLQIGLPLLIFLGGLSTLSIYFFILNNFLANSDIVKIRVLFILMTNISVSVMFAESGQGIVDETDKIFDAFASCPWYNWNLKNRKTLLICMASSTNPLSFGFAGITIGYNFAVSMARFSFSYALTLFQLNNAK